MKSNTRPRIALVVEASRAYGRELLRGVSLFARTQADWSLLHQEMMLDSELPDWIEQGHITGVIARVDTHTIEPLRRLRVPIVDVRCNRKFQSVPQVETDNDAVAELAFEHLWERGFRKFAFSGFRFASYSQARRDHFRRLVEKAGCELSVYESGGSPSGTLTKQEQAGVFDLRQMAEWIDTLERPTGLFVCNDIRGQQLLNACRYVDVAIPDDLGVIGVDDDDAICMMCDPTLSSVRPNAERVGYRAAEVLHCMLSGISPEQETEYIAPVKVTERQSTQVVAIEDEELAKVCRFIRQAACDGINVADVVEFSSLSRRPLERRFRDELDITPRELITETQINRVKQLLRETGMTLEQISKRTGFSHKERLSAVFKRETGQTPGCYREEHSD